MGACPESRREKAMTSDIRPFMTSFMRTAVAAEYLWDDGVETRE